MNAAMGMIGLSSFLWRQQSQMSAALLRLVLVDHSHGACGGVDVQGRLEVKIERDIASLLTFL